jgi:hypothetical protein
MAKITLSKTFQVLIDIVKRKGGNTSYSTFNPIAGQSDVAWSDGAFFWFSNYLK